MALSNSGEEVCPKIAKTIALTFPLHILLGKLYAGGASWVHQRLFEQKFYSDIHFGCGTQKLMHYSGGILTFLCSIVIVELVQAASPSSRHWITQNFWYLVFAIGVLLSLVSTVGVLLLRRYQVS